MKASSIDTDLELAQFGWSDLYVNNTISHFKVPDKTISKNKVVKKLSLLEIIDSTVVHALFLFILFYCLITVLFELIPNTIDLHINLKPLYSFSKLLNIRKPIYQ